MYNMWLSIRTHRQTTIISGYATTEGSHTPKYACSVSGCTTTYNGTSAEHASGTHKNEGKCTTCNYQYQIHELKTISRYITTPEKHTPVYKCSISDCTTTQVGNEEEHTVTTWEDNGNGTHSGECTICAYKVTQEHNYQNGNCSDCKAAEQKVECEHSYISKNDETYHWEECSKCKQIKSGTLKVHENGEYKDNGDGTHSVTCKVCEYKITEEHNYENGKCSECDAKQSEAKCNHTFVIRNNQSRHWEECSKCSEIKTGSQEEHKFGSCADNGNGTHTSTCSKCGYKLTEVHSTDEGCEDCMRVENGNDGEDTNDDELDKDNNLGGNSSDGNSSNGNNSSGNNSDGNSSDEDDTVVGTDIPKAGIRNIILIVIISLVSISSLIVIKMKKYKDI